MEFPERYIKRGKFTLHSGEVSDRLYDVNAMLTDKFWLDYVLNNVPRGFSYAGIATAGAIIASHFVPYAIVKDKELKGKLEGDYCLIDDVCTTENSLRRAIEIIGREPSYVFVVVDRRREKKMKVNSFFEV